MFFRTIKRWPDLEILFHYQEKWLIWRKIWQKKWVSECVVYSCTPVHWSSHNARTRVRWRYKERRLLVRYQRMRGSSVALVLRTIENASVLRRNSRNTPKDDSKNCKNTPQRTTTAYRIYDKHSIKLSICKGRGKCYEDEDAPPAVFGPQKKNKLRCTCKRKFLAICFRDQHNDKFLSLRVSVAQIYTIIGK